MYLKDIKSVWFLRPRYTLAYSLACEPFKIEFTDRNHGCMHLALVHYPVHLRFLSPCMLSLRSSNVNDFQYNKMYIYKILTCKMYSLSFL